MLKWKLLPRCAHRRSRRGSRSLLLRKREAFSDNFSSSVERARDSIVEGYYEAKDRYNRYRNKLTEETNDLLDEIEDND